MAQSPSVPLDAGRQLTVERLYRSHHEWLVAWLRRKLSNRDLAQDLAHDTFLSAMAAPDLHALDEPRAFLTTVARRVSANWYRRQQIEQAYLEAVAGLPQALAPSPEARCLLVEALLEIDRRLSGLPAKVRQAFLMAQLDGASYAEIAGALGVSVASVKKYMARAALCCYFPE